MDLLTQKRHHLLRLRKGGTGRDHHPFCVFMSLVRVYSSTISSKTNKVEQCALLSLLAVKTTSNRGRSQLNSYELKEN